MKILVFDNYDSFTFNLVHLIRQLDYTDIDVVRNDKISLGEIEKYDKIVLSPGSGIPSEAGLLLELIKCYAPTKSILGVCLGHQAIGEAFGARLLNMPDVYHGVATPVTVTDGGLIFAGLPEQIVTGRYHSWIVDREGFPEEELKITAVDDKGNIMALSHHRYDVHGVQFHPESVLTRDGAKIVENFLKS